MPWISALLALLSICSTLLQRCQAFPVESESATPQDPCCCTQDDSTSVPADIYEHRQTPDPEDEPCYTCSRNGSFVTINITSGNMAGEIIAFDVDEVWRNTLRARQDQSLNRKDAFLLSEEPPEDELPAHSYHGPHGRQISEEEYERLVALEEFHEEQGTLHLLYPEQYEEGYSIPEEYYDNDDEDGGD